MRASSSTDSLSGSYLTENYLWGSACLSSYFFFLVCANALPAADLDALLVLPSRSVFDAAEAAFLEVCRFGVPVCDRALPAAFLDVFPVDLEVRVFDALEAAFFPVVFLLTAMHEHWSKDLYLSRFFNRTVLDHSPVQIFVLSLVVMG